MANTRVRQYIKLQYTFATTTCRCASRTSCAISLTFPLPRKWHEYECPHRGFVFIGCSCCLCQLHKRHEHDGNPHIWHKIRFFFACAAHMFFVCQTMHVTRCWHLCVWYSVVANARHADMHLHAHRCTDGCNVVWARHHGYLTLAGLQFNNILICRGPVAFSALDWLATMLRNFTLISSMFLNSGPGSKTTSCIRDVGIDTN